MAFSSVTTTTKKLCGAMDKFLVKTSRLEMTKESPTKPKKGMKQMTIGAMKGVVVVEQILRLKSVLRVKDQDKTTLLEAMRELQEKVPSREVLLDTKIGRTVNKLTTHKDDEVSRLASVIVNEWKSYHLSKANRPMLEVRCDHKTEKHREAGRKLLAGALDGSDTKALSESIEREAFNRHGHLINAKYRRTMRNLVFQLKKHEDVRDKVVKHTISAKDLITMYKDS